MRLQVIGHQDAVWGFALVGVPGCIVTTAEELHAALDAALADATVGIIMVTDDVAALARELQKTRRRVNALQHVLIPRYEAAVTCIEDALEEREREETFRLKRLKRQQER